jgi:hypothetical protein
MAITVTPDPKLANDSLGLSEGDGSPYTLGVAITPHDANASLTFLPRAISCTAAGNVCLVWKDGTNTVLSIAVGHPLRVRPYAVAATNTTATGLVALK